jgi:glucose-1-phosphate adenylyltransferase
MKGPAAILLAGGVGSRLNILVRHRAKPAVPFGGIYRIIDFTLSNIGNSEMTSVAVLTQYKPLSLMDHIGDGSSWDLSGRSRSVKIFPPKTGEEDWDWYRGTADAVRQNISFVMSAKSDEIMILSGDHVYHMDYRRMVSFHRQKKARVTIATIPVPWGDTPVRDRRHGRELHDRSVGGEIAPREVQSGVDVDIRLRQEVPDRPAHGVQRG